MIEGAGGIPGLTYTGNYSWRSEAGLLDRQAANGKENRLRHVFRHITPNSANPDHTDFKTPPKELPKLLDEAWKKKGDHVPGDPGVVVVDLGRSI